VAGTERREENSLFMASSHSWSTCSCNGLGVQNRSDSCHGGGSKRLGSMPVCYCGEQAFLRTARTLKNRGKQFWGCPKYKVRSMEL